MEHDLSWIESWTRARFSIEPHISVSYLIHSLVVARVKYKSGRTGYAIFNSLKERQDASVTKIKHNI